ncbi:MAG: MFS transporter, partial [Chloroflexota bacterium]
MNRKIIPVILLMFVNRLGLTILVPVLPFVVRDYGQSDLVYGLLLSAYSGFIFFGSPVLGSLSDRFGRKPILLLSQAGTLASWFVFGLAWFLPGNVWPLVVIAISRVVDGITGGNVSVANAYLSDVTSREERTRAFTWLIAAGGTALIIGPPIGSLSSANRLGFLGTAIAAIVISTVTLLAIYFGLNESLPKSERIKKVNLNPLYQLNMVAKIRDLKNSVSIRRVLTTRVFLSLTLQSYVSIIVLFIIDLFNFSETDLGFFLLFIGSFLIINQLFVFPIFARYLNDTAMLLLGLTLTGIGLWLITLASSIFTFLITYYVLNVGISLAMPTVKSLLTKLSVRQQQGVVMGVDEGLIALTGAIGPAIAGLLYAQVDRSAFLVFSGVALTGLILTFISRGAINRDI